jgi:hypothetical protein
VRCYLTFGTGAGELTNCDLQADVHTGDSGAVHTPVYYGSDADDDESSARRRLAVARARARSQETKRTSENQESENQEHENDEIKMMLSEKIELQLQQRRLDAGDGTCAACGSGQYRVAGIGCTSRMLGNYNCYKDKGASNVRVDTINGVII